MGYIKESKGIDLIIPPSKLTQKEAAEISEFIRLDKLKNIKAKAKRSLKELIQK